MITWWTSSVWRGRNFAPYSFVRPNLKCLNKVEVLLTWLGGQDAFWVGKKLCAIRLVISPECFHCGNAHSSPLCGLIGGFMVRILHGKIFALEANSVCRNAVTPLINTEHYVSFCLLGNSMRMRSLPLPNFFTNLLKVKIKTERKRFSSSEFDERWAIVSRLRWVNDADLVVFGCRLAI